MRVLGPGLTVEEAIELMPTVSVETMELVGALLATAKLPVPVVETAKAQASGPGDAKS